MIAESKAQRNETALAVALVCGLAAVACVLWAGRGNPSWTLKAMFAVWVAAPFAFMVWCCTWRLKAVVLVLSVVSVAVYVTVAMHSPRQMAAPFLAVPVVSWIVLGVAWVMGKKT